MVDSGNGWNEHRRLVVKSLEDLQTQADKIQLQIAALQVDVASLRVAQRLQSGFWGGVAGVIAAIIIVIVQLVAQS